MPARPERQARILRFAVSGLAATGVHAMAAYLLIGAGAGAGWGNAMAALAATIASYLMHTLWSFGAAIGAGNALRFVAVAVFCASVAGVVGKFVATASGSANLSILAVILIVPPLSFLLHNFWTYRR